MNHEEDCRLSLLRNYPKLVLTNPFPIASGIATDPRILRCLRCGWLRKWEELFYL